jgi:hypothetical protein
MYPELPDQKTEKMKKSNQKKVRKPGFLLEVGLSDTDGILNFSGLPFQAATWLSTIFLLQ